MQGLIVFVLLCLFSNIQLALALGGVEDIKATLKDPYQGRNFSQGTNPHLQEIYVGRCYAILGASPSNDSLLYRSQRPSPSETSPHTYSSRNLPLSSSQTQIHISNDNDPMGVCIELWKLFSSAFRYKNDSDILPSAFLPYFNHPAILATIDPSINQGLFWSGVSSLIPTYQAATNSFVMETSSLIQIVSDLMYCGSTSDPSGFDYSSCIYGDFNTTGDGQWHGTYVSYWAAASIAYAPRVSGNITILLRGSPSPYRRNSFFGSCELPNLPYSKITGVQVFVAPDMGMKYDTCGEGSIAELLSDLVKVGVNESIITCTNNPPLIRLIDCLHCPVSSQCLLN